MKTNALLLLCLFSSVASMAQMGSKHVKPMTYENVYFPDTLFKKAAAKHVKTFEYSRDADGRHILISTASFSKAGKIEYSRWGSAKPERVFYSYTDSTVAIRRMKPDYRKYGTSGNVLVSKELYDLKGNELSYYYKSCKPDKDTLVTPTEGWVNKLKKGLLKQRIYTNGDTSTYSYDKQGNLSEVKNRKGVVTEKYRRVYAGNKLTESSYSSYGGTEKIIEKFEYNALGLMVKSTDYLNALNEIYEGGTWKTYEYDAARRVSKFAGEIGDNRFVEKIYYDSKNRVVKVESSLNESGDYVSSFTYNDQGLLVSHESRKSDNTEISVKTCSYTFWE